MLKMQSLQHLITTNSLTLSRESRMRHLPASDTHKPGKSIQRAPHLCLSTIQRESVAPCCLIKLIRSFNGRHSQCTGWETCLQHLVRLPDCILRVQRPELSGVAGAPKADLMVLKVLCSTCERLTPATDPDSKPHELDWLVSQALGLT